MKQLEPPRPKKKGGRYWTADHPTKGAHQFRFGTFSSVANVYDYAVRTDGIKTDVKSTWALHELAGRRCALIGKCWHHRLWALETPEPSVDASHAELLKYGESVLDELQDEGYDSADVMVLFHACLQEVSGRFGILTSARKTADFGPGDGKGGPTPAKASPTPPASTPDASTS